MKAQQAIFMFNKYLECAIGTVDSCVKNEGDMQYTVVIKPLIDFSLLTYCFVIEKKL